MRTRLLVSACVVAVTLLGGRTVFAHHSTAATYDTSKEIKLEGKIVQLLFRNPHTFMHIEAPDQDGKLQRWALEWRSVGSLNQQGISRDTLKDGDEVTITMNPSRTPADHRGVLLSLHRKSDGFGWDTKSGDNVD